MLLIYTVGLTALLLLLTPLLPLLLLHPRVRAGLAERLGFLPRSVRDQAWLDEGSLWVHAASLGEVNAVAPVLRELAPKLPRLRVVVTCTTAAGREQARRLFPQASACLILPLDLPWMLEPWIRRLKPRLTLVAETELWPNFLGSLKRYGSKVLVVNGRLTERSARRYARLGRSFTEVLEKVDLFAMQADGDAQRLIALGARAARVQVTGNTKFDLAGDLAPAVEAAPALRKSLGWERGAELVVVGSSRPGEEALLLQAFRALKRSRPGLRMVLAPRHLERVDEVLALLKKERVSFARRSQGGAADKADVLLLDTLGELRAFYALAIDAGVAWVGGSFKDFGGQNPLEPAALGVPVLFGPHMRHFPDIAAALLAGQGASQVGLDALAAESAAILGDPKRRRAMAAAAQACVREHAGASRRSSDLGLRLLLLDRLSKDAAWREQGFEKFRASAEFGSALEEPDWRHEAPHRPAQGGEFGLGLEKDDDGTVG